MKNGEIFYIDFKGNRGSEINNIHLGIIFTILSILISLKIVKNKEF